MKTNSRKGRAKAYVQVEHGGAEKKDSKGHEGDLRLGHLRLTGSEGH